MSPLYYEVFFPTNTRISYAKIEIAKAVRDMYEDEVQLYAVYQNNEKEFLY